MMDGSVGVGGRETELVGKRELLGPRLQGSPKHEKEKAGPGSRAGSPLTFGSSPNNSLSSLRCQFPGDPEIHRWTPVSEEGQRGPKGRQLDFPKLSALGV